MSALKKATSRKLADGPSSKKNMSLSRKTTSSVQSGTNSEDDVIAASDVDDESSESMDEVVPISSSKKVVKKAEVSSNRSRSKAKKAGHVNPQIAFVLGTGEDSRQVIGQVTRILNVDVPAGMQLQCTFQCYMMGQNHTVSVTDEGESVEKEYRDKHNALVSITAAQLGRACSVLHGVQTAYVDTAMWGRILFKAAEWLVPFCNCPTRSVRSHALELYYTLAQHAMYHHVRYIGDEVRGVSAMEALSRELTNTVDELAEFEAEMYTVIQNRYRDVDAPIRESLLAFLSKSWIIAPSLMLSGSTLKYMAWLSVDTDPRVRAASLDTLSRQFMHTDGVMLKVKENNATMQVSGMIDTSVPQRYPYTVLPTLYSSPYHHLPYARMDGETIRSMTKAVVHKFQERFLLMTRDQDISVSVAAYRFLSLAISLGFVFGAIPIQIQHSNDEIARGVAGMLYEDSFYDMISKQAEILGQEMNTEAPGSALIIDNHADCLASGVEDVLEVIKIYHDTKEQVVDYPEIRTHPQARTEHQFHQLISTMHPFIPAQHSYKIASMLLESVDLSEVHLQTIFNMFHLGNTTMRKLGSKDVVPILLKQMEENISSPGLCYLFVNILALLLPEATATLKTSACALLLRIVTSSTNRHTVKKASSILGSQATDNTLLVSIEASVLSLQAALNDAWVIQLEEGATAIAKVSSIMHCSARLTELAQACCTHLTVKCRVLSVILDHLHELTKITDEIATETWWRGRGGRTVQRDFLKCAHTLTFSVCLDLNQEAHALFVRYTSILSNTLPSMVALFGHHSPKNQLPPVLTSLEVNFYTEKVIASHTLFSPSVCILILTNLTEVCIYGCSISDHYNQHLVESLPFPITVLPVIMELGLYALRMVLTALTQANIVKSTISAWILLDEELYTMSLLAKKDEEQVHIAAPTVYTEQFQHIHIYTANITHVASILYPLIIHVHSLLISLALSTAKLAVQTPPEDFLYAMPALLTHYKQISKVYDSIVVNTCKQLRTRTTGSLYIAKSLSRALLLMSSRKEQASPSTLMILANMCGKECIHVATVLVEKAFEEFPQNMSLLATAKAFLTNKVSTEDQKLVAILLGTLGRKKNVATQMQEDGRAEWVDALELLRGTLEKKGILVKSDIIPKTPYTRTKSTKSSVKRAKSVSSTTGDQSDSSSGMEGVREQLDFEISSSEERQRKLQTRKIVTPIQTIEISSSEE